MNTQQAIPTKLEPTSNTAMQTAIKDIELIQHGAQTGNTQDNATGVLEPNFGSVLDFSVKPPTNSDFGLSRVFYTFQPFENVTVSIGPNIRTTDYIDRNSYANLSNRDFSTLALVNNSILVPLLEPGAGATVEWNPGAGALTLRTLYAASDPANPGREGPSMGVSLFANLLYPVPSGSSPTAPGAPPAAPRSDRDLFFFANINRQ